MNNVTIILGGSADIGGFLVTKYLSLGHTVLQHAEMITIKIN